MHDDTISISPTPDSAASAEPLKVETMAAPATPESEIRKLTYPAPVESAMKRAREIAHPTKPLRVHADETGLPLIQPYRTLAKLARR